jgi:GTP-binding protein Era
METKDTRSKQEQEGNPFRAGFVALVGKPNAGKSTLFNAYLGQKIAIVSPRPQTTRIVIRGALTLPAAQVIFLDTPGVHRPVHRLGEFMVEMAGRAVADADVVVFLADLTTPPDAEDRAIVDLLRARSHAPLLLALNKADAVGDAKAAGRPYLDLLRDHDGRPLFAAAIPLSATAGRGRQELLETILARLPESPPYYPEDFLTDQPVRAIAAELVREQVMLYTHDEIPHAVTAVVDEFKERSPEMTYIAVTIYVERESQKGILLGHQGQMMKRIGRAARREIEALLDTRVYLELWVKVRKNWRKDPQALRWLGYDADVARTELSSPTV